jgi:hypothetical protein
MPLDCGHPYDLQHLKVCRHIWEHNASADFAYVFTEDELECRICVACARMPNEFQSHLRSICTQCLDKLEFRGLELLSRQPGIRERKTEQTFIHRQVRMDPELAKDIRTIEPIPYSKKTQWVAVTADGRVVKIDLTHEPHVLDLFRVQPEELLLSDQILLEVSLFAEFVVVANKFGEAGLVINTSARQITMKLNRGNHYPEHTLFPAVFIELNNELYVVHSTAWNRLDISDPETGKLLTERAPTSYKQDEPEPTHYLDYSHTQLIVSPDNQWVAEYGWVWHPIGYVRCWNIQQWLNTNAWESEDGSSLKRFADAAYFWNGPMCWIDSQTLAVWGGGQDEEDMIPAVRMFDVRTGEQVQWFYGPEQGSLFFDQYLFSISQNGTDVWDVNTGERLLHDPVFYPIHYHRGSKQFLSILPDGIFQLSRLSPSKVE